MTKTIRKVDNLIGTQRRILVLKALMILAIFFAAQIANADMSVADCVTFIETAYHTRTGLNIVTPNNITDLCTGIVQLITTEALVQPGISTPAGPTTSTGTIK